MTSRATAARALLLSCCCVAVWVLASRGEARPGGGQGYSGGSSGSSGSSGGSYSGGSSGSSGSSSSSRGGSGGTIDSPWVFPLVFGSFGAFAIYAVVANYADVKRRTAEWQNIRKLKTNSTSGSNTPPPPSFTVLRERDPDFSQVLFEDLACGLYARVHTSRHDPAAMTALLPYVKPAVAGGTAWRLLAAPVESVIIGSMTITQVHVDQRIEVAFEANLMSASANEYVRETWAFDRDPGVRTRPWKGVRKLGCPSCGAPIGASAASTCASCGATLEAGRLDWSLASVRVHQHNNRPPSLAGTVEEKGTDSPTKEEDGILSRLDELQSDDPASTREALGQRFQLIYSELTAAWNARDLRTVRPYVSAPLYASLHYWIRAYEAQGLRNVLEDAAVSRIAFAKVVRDRHFDAVTVRFWATGKDYTLDSAGQVVGGSRTTPRGYSEYWTLIRGAGVRGAPRTDKSCPACGAALDVGAEGQCAFCGVVVASAEYDWVLSRIEQDEAYRG